MFTRRERKKSARSLVCLLQGLVGQHTTLELRNEIAVCGIVVEVDSRMNTVLKEAETTKLNGHKERFEELTLRGAQIRYVHIPESIDVMEAIRKQFYQQKTRTTSYHLQKQTKILKVSVLVGGGGGKGGGSYRRRPVKRGTRQRHEEERRAAREYKLGRGRGGGGGVGHGGSSGGGGGGGGVGGEEVGGSKRKEN